MVIGNNDIKLNKIIHTHTLNFPIGEQKLYNQKKKNKHYKDKIKCIKVNFTAG